METYFAVVHKDLDSSYGISFPDLPGCFSAADDMASIYDRAQEALGLYLRGQGHFPKARSIEQLRIDPEVGADIASGAFLLAVPLIAAAGTKERINVMLDTALLAGLDRSARIVGLSRSEYIARAVVRTLKSQGGLAVLSAGESTSKKVASAAAKTLGSKSASPAAKKVAASALTQSKSKEATSATVASTAAKMLRDPKASKAEKTVAASALTQKPGKKK